MCLLFFHKYKIVKAIKAKGIYFSTPYTVLNSVCQKCNKTKVETIDGHFEMEDFNKETL